MIAYSRVLVLKNKGVYRAYFYVAGLMWVLEWDFVKILQTIRKNQLNEKIRLKCFSKCRLDCLKHYGCLVK